MNVERLLQHFYRICEAPDAIPRLRSFILDLAVRGNLVSQDPDDAPATKLLKRIETEKLQLGAEGKINPPKAQIPATANDLDFELRQGWCPARISEILVELQTGPFGSSLHQSDYQIGGTPVINPASMKNGLLVPIEVMAVGPRALERLATFKLRTGDIVMARRGEMGRCAIVTEKEDGWLCGTGSLILRLPTCIFGRFFVILINSPRVRSYLGAAAVGATMQNLNQSILLSLPIGLPPLAEQHRIVAKVDELMSHCDHLEEAKTEREQSRDRLVAASLHRLEQSPDIAEAADRETFRAHASFALNNLPRLTSRLVHIKQLRQSILGLAVRGKLVSQDSNDEPAEDLLKRIQAEKARLGKPGKLRGEVTIAPLPQEKCPYLIPPAWEWAPLGQIVISRDGERIPVSKEERNRRAKNYDYYGASGVIDKIDIYLFDKPLLLIGEDGANLINRSTPIAFIARGKYWVNNHAHVLDGTSETFLRFIELYINAIDLKPYVTGTAQPKMNQAKMNSIPIALPPEAEQHRIVAKVDELMALCDQLEAQVVTTEADSRHLLEAVLHEALAPGAAEAA